jgi:type I restriction enzyme S subunit
MSEVQELITKHIDIWTAAKTEKRSGRGRASGNAGSVYGIKKMRELILELAVRGKLVPQDDNDEPASELLKRIFVEKAKLIADRKIKKDKPFSPIAEDEEHYELPSNWVWTRLGEITNFGITEKLEQIPDDMWVLDLEDIEKDTSKLLQKFKFSERRSLSDKNSFRGGDVLYGKLRPYLNKVIVADESGVCTTEILPIRCYSTLDSDYLKNVLKCPNFVSYVNARSYGMKMPRLGTEDGRKAVFPLPPLAEQHRIVAKVDELMALCDQLEAQHNNAAEAHEQLVSHLLGTLTQSQDAADFNANWQRIAMHFDTLFTTESSIDALKQTLLQLAVMGKLVPQDPNDEPASELLKRIQVEKAKLVAEGKIKKEQSSSPIDNTSEPFAIPYGWKWCRLAELMAIVTDGDHQAPPKAESGVPFLVIGNLNTGEVLLENCRYVPFEYYDKLDYIKKPTKNDLLYTVTGSYGIPIKVKTNDKFCVQRHVAILKVTSATPIDYLMFLLQSKYSLDYATEIATGIAQKTVPLSGLRLMPIALPSASEQRRIVAKVETLLSLCDQLKLRIVSTNQVQRNLTDALIEQVIS